MGAIITNEDIEYLVNQTDISLVLSGMMSLLQDSDNKVEEIQKQNWFGRMWKTVTGKNKATKDDVRQNHEKLSAYMTQAMQILYERNVMTQQMVNNLGLQLNVLYQENNQLKEMLGSFVEKLNEKITSVDNFHMLSEEIRLKMYTNEKSVVAICKIVTQLDERTVNDPRKLEILQQSLVQEGILSENSISLHELFSDLLTCSTEEAGQFMLGLGAIRQQYLPSLFLGFLESYYFMSDMEQKLKSKEKFCSSYLDIKQIDSDISLSSLELYLNSIDSLKESFAVLNLSTDATSVSISDDTITNDTIAVDTITEDTITENSSSSTISAPEESSNLSDFVIENGCLLKYLGFEASVSIPDCVSEIGENAFGFNNSIISVVIPNSVTIIQKAAFQQCNFLASIVIPNSVTTIEDGAFFYCSSLTSVVIPNSVTKIDNRAFSHCEALATVVLPDSLHIIEGGTFWACRNLTKVTIPDSIKAIKYTAFSGCESLVTLVIPHSVDYIGEEAFSNCTALTSVVLPAYIRIINKKAFYGCKSLSSVVFRGSRGNIDIHPTAFKKTPSKNSVKN